MSKSVETVLVTPEVAPETPKKRRNTREKQSVRHVSIPEEIYNIVAESAKTNFRPITYELSRLLTKAIDSERVGA